MALALELKIMKMREYVGVHLRRLQAGVLNYAAAFWRRRGGHAEIMYRRFYKASVVARG